MSVGMIVSTISILINTYYQLDAIHKNFDASSSTAVNYKKEFLSTHTDNFKNYLRAVDITPEFKDLIASENEKNITSKIHVTQVMMTIARADQNIMQFRFIDKDGYESIRIDRDKITKEPYQIPDDKLQDKSKRYYFQDTKKIGQSKTWFSNIDLNIEHSRVQQPIVPTLRIAKPYYVSDEFRGVLIINIFMKKILDEVINSEPFNIAIIDKNNNILTSNIQKYKNWTQYLDHKDSIKYTMPTCSNPFLGLFFDKKYIHIELSDTIKNSEGLKIVLEEKTKAIIEYSEHILSYTLIMSTIIFIISFPMAVVLSKYPLKLHDRLKNFKNKLEKKLKIIDKYVYMSRTDIDGKITDVSKAFCELSGYSKDELIGNTHRILKDPSTPESFYKEMWDSILAGKKWTGLVKNISKNGTPYWVKTHITPEVSDNKIVSFTAISQNITDQKDSEEISLKDELTQAYNRRYFNQIFSKELKRSKRNEETFCIAMFDIDYFKKYNDTYGHIQGDEALQKVVAGVSAKLQRPSDYLFRVGGEEFIIIFSDVINPDEARAFSSTIVKAVEALNIEHKSSEVSDVLTISLGLLTITPPCYIDDGSILKRIDELLYKAKNSGRNKLIVEDC